MAKVKKVIRRKRRSEDPPKVSAKTLTRIPSNFVRDVRQVEVSECDVKDALLIRVRDAGGEVLRQFMAEELDHDPLRTFSVVAEVASGAADIDSSRASLIESMLQDSDNMLRVYLYAMARRMMWRGKKLANYIDEIEEELYPRVNDPDNPIDTKTLVRLLGIQLEEQERGLGFIKDMAFPRKDAAISPVVNAPSVHLHEHTHGAGVDLKPSQRERLRNIIDALKATGNDGSSEDI